MAQVMLDQCEQGTVAGEVYSANLRLVDACLRNAELSGKDTAQERQRFALLESHKEDM